MTDRELLTLAAKAARYPVRGIAAQMVTYLPDDAPHIVIGNDRGGDSVWNPLANDGDALRLAVQLRLEIRPDADKVTAAGNGVWEEVQAGGDRLSATRLAIVRAAAEIGKAI